MEVEDRAIRERLRGLAVAFLAEDTRERRGTGTGADRHAVQGEAIHSVVLLGAPTDGRVSHRQAVSKFGGKDMVKI